jgi:hypothetical protein
MSNGMSNVKIARKKPIEIEVIQITDENIKEIRGFCGQFAFKRISPVSFSIETF